MDEIQMARAKVIVCLEAIGSLTIKQREELAKAIEDLCMQAILAKADAR